MFGIRGKYHSTPISERPGRMCTSCGRTVAPGPGGLLGVVVEVTCTYCVTQGPVGQRKAERDARFGRNR